MADVMKIFKIDDSTALEIDRSILEYFIMKDFVDMMYPKGSIKGYVRIIHEALENTNLNK